MTQQAPEQVNETPTYLTVDQMFPWDDAVAAELTDDERQALINKRKAYEGMLAQLDGQARTIRSRDGEITRLNARLTEVRQQSDTNIAYLRVAMQVTMELNELLGGEVTPDIKYFGANVDLYVTYAHERARFQVIINDDKTAQLQVTPTSERLRPMVFPLDENGIPTITVLALGSYLGLNNTPVTTRAFKDIVREDEAPTNRRTTIVASDMGDARGLIGAFLGGNCGNPECPIHGTPNQSRQEWGGGRR